MIISGVDCCVFVSALAGGSSTPQKVQAQKKTAFEEYCRARGGKSMCFCRNARILCLGFRIKKKKRGKK